MAHKLIVGTSETGKSTLARAMENEAHHRGIVTVVHDPTMNADWKSEFVTPDEYEFFLFIYELHKKGMTRIAAFVDEADTIMSMSHRHNWWLFTRGRHFGIEAVAITQRPTMISPTVRGQPSDVYVFRVPKSDAKELANDQAAEGLIEAAELGQGEFLRAYWKDRKKVIDRLRAF